MFSAVHEITDIAKILRYVRFVPEPEVNGAQADVFESSATMRPGVIRRSLLSSNVRWDQPNRASTKLAAAFAPSSANAD